MAGRLAATLGFPPSEIYALEIEQAQFWDEVAQAKLKRESELLGG